MLPSKVKSITKGQALLLMFLLASLPLVHSQTDPGEEEAISFVGLTLSELISRFGVPQFVYAARGLEDWQDDVVFVYEQGNFYIYRDRVWQVGIRSIRGINTGDPQGVVSLIMGSNAVDRGSSMFYPLHVRPWPLMLRWDFENGRVQSIFIYRADF